MKHRLPVIKFSVPPFSDVDRRVLYLNVFMTNRSIKSVYTVNENNSNGCSDLLTQSAVNVTDLHDSSHGPSICGLNQTLHRPRMVSVILQRTTKKAKSHEREWNSYTNFTSILNAIFKNYECMKMMNCTEMSHCITLTHVPFLIKCNDAFIIKQYKSLDSTSYSKTWL